MTPYYDDAPDAPTADIVVTSPPYNMGLTPGGNGGTTLRAAKDAGVRAVGIEKSERYCEIAARRLAQGVLAL